MSLMRSPGKESPGGRARSAMNLLSRSITWDEVHRVVEGDDTVRLGLDAMASALIDWADLDLVGAPLDEVLASLGQDNDLVESTARLIALVSQASYDTGLGRESIQVAEGLRERVVDELDALLTRLQEEAKEDPDA